MIQNRIHHSFLIAVILCSATLLSCKPGAKPVKPDTFLRQFHDAIRDHYYFYPDTDFKYNLSEVYAAALKEATQSEDSSADIQTAIQRIQAFSPDPEKQSQAALKFVEVVLNRLPDQSSYYIDPVSLELLNDDDRNGGTGIVIRKNADGRFRIVDVLDGSPAQRDDVAVNSYIDAVDGASVSGLSVEGVAARIRGPLDTEVELTLNGKSHKLVRSQFPSPAPTRNTWQIGESKVLVVQLRSALPGSTDTLKNVLGQTADRSALVLDIRKLNFGEFSEVFHMADLLVSDGLLGSTEGRDKAEEAYRADSDRLFSGPVYVLVSASASPFAEVLAAALKASPNVILVGPDLKGNAFLADSIPLGSGKLQITTGIVKGSDGRPLFLEGIKTDLRTEDFLPVRAPLSSPDSDDPGHQAVLDHLSR